MAALTDAVNGVRYMVQAVNAQDPKSVRLPEPIPQPGMKRLTRHLADSAEAEAARRYLREFNTGKG